MLTCDAPERLPTFVRCACSARFTCACHASCPVQPGSEMLDPADGRPTAYAGAVTLLLLKPVGLD